MQHTKRLLSLLLTLILAFGLAVPAVFAQEEDDPRSTVNWDDFYIVTQPQQEQSIKKGESFTISFDVHVPEGVEVTYEWYGIADGFFKMTTAGPALVCNPGDTQYPVLDSTLLPNAVGSASYGCWITCREKDGDEVISEKQLPIDKVAVEMKGSIGDLLLSFLNAPIIGLMGPFTAIMPALMSGGITYPFLLVYFTLVMPIGLLVKLIAEYVAY